MAGFELRRIRGAPRGVTTGDNDMEAFTMHKSDAAGSSIEAPEAIWNPVATVNWSLLFTPAFGSWLQMLNWESLGEPELAAISKRWFYTSLAMLLLYHIAGIAFAGNADALLLLRAVPFLYLVTWYLGSARLQMKYVKERFKDNYNRRPWKKPLLAATGLAVMYFALQVVVGALFGSGAS
jgi:hypothetical protein